jgi:hypothetical protein
LRQASSVSNMAVCSVPVIIDQDNNLRYECHNCVSQIFRVPALLFLNLLPTKLSRAIFLAFTSPNGDTPTVISSVATYKALEVMYTFPTRRAGGETGIADFFWEHFLSNARAIRNRLLLVERELLTAINETSRRKGKVCLLSLGSGSARAVLEVASLLSHEPPIRIKLIDVSRQAIGYSQELARSLNLDHIEWHRGSVENLERYCNGFHPDVVELVGLLDYISEDKAVNLISKIYKALSAGGWLIAGNIRGNLEAPFVSKVIGWSLIYREPHELVDLVTKAGFSAEHVRIVYEPLRIHGLAICRKPPPPAQRLL